MLENDVAFFLRNPGSLPDRDLDRFSSKIIFVSLRSGGFKKIESSIFTQMKKVYFMESTQFHLSFN